MNFKNGNSNTRWQRAIDLVASKLVYPVVFLAGFVALSWRVDVRDFGGPWTMMKEPTAIALFTLALAFIGLARRKPNEVTVFLVILAGLFVTGLMVGINNDDWRALYTLAVRPDTSPEILSQQLPSVGVMVLACVGSAACILFPVTRSRMLLAAVSFVLVVGGALALAGYLLDLPAFYYYQPGSSTAMSPLTAGCFLLLGLYLTYLAVKNGFLSARHEALEHICEER